MGSGTACPRVGSIANWGTGGVRRGAAVKLKGVMSDAARPGYGATGGARARSSMMTRRENGG
eukprot:342800-Prymnesium_polylepis.1